jgi:hypothetical protein
MQICGVGVRAIGKSRLLAFANPNRWSAAG